MKLHCRVTKPDGDILVEGIMSRQALDAAARRVSPEHALMSESSARSYEGTVKDPAGELPAWRQLDGADVCE